MIATRLTLLSRFFVLVSLSACAHGFNREGLRSDLEHRMPQQIEIAEEGPVTAEKIRDALARKPQLRFPFSLAVYDAGGCGGRTAGERDGFAELESKLKARGVVSQMYYLSPLVAKDSTLKSVRFAAAQHGADAVFYYRCVSEEERYLNSFSILYLTIFGFWAAPGHTVDVLLMYQGALWDVRNEYLYLTVEAEGQGSTFGPLATISPKPARERARAAAMKAFREEFASRMGDLK